MGNSASRGWVQIASTDIIRNLWSKLNSLSDSIAADVPYRGTTTANSDANGFATITHGLGFTPSMVFVQSKIVSINVTTNVPIVTGVDTLTATTFRIRVAGIKASTGGSYFLQFGGLTPAKAFAINWQAFR